MKVAISLPQDLYEQAEALANHRKKSRSALYAEALKAYLQSQEDEEITARLNQVYSSDDFSEETTIVKAALRSFGHKYDKW